VRALLVAAGVGLCWLLGLTRLLIATSGGTAAAADDSMDARSRRHKASAAPAPQGIIAASAPSPPPLSPSTPFVLNFESSSGSSWLIQELAAHPQACTVLFEPIDNISLASAEDRTRFDAGLLSSEPILEDAEESVQAVGDADA
jgi:hypothetical protein